jgi:hypothetical protein
MRSIDLVSIVLVAIAATMVTTPAAHATTYKWCAYYAGREGGGTNCGFVTYQQCKDAISGNGGYCAENPAYTGDRKRR